MKRSDIFNLQRPWPADKFVYPIYQNFLELQREVMENWKREVVNNLLGERNYQDILDCRSDVTKNGTLTLRIKPVIGFDTEEEFQTYIKFFDLYRSFITIIHVMIRNLDEVESSFGIYNDPMLDDINDYNKELLKVKKQRTETTNNVHLMAMSIKLLVAMMNRQVLQLSDLVELHEALLQDTSLFADTMDQLIRDRDSELIVDKEYKDSDKPLYKFGDANFIESCWNYVRNNPFVVDNKGFMIQHK